MKKLYTLIIGIVLLASCKTKTDEEGKTEDMNILFIAIEDWSAEAVGCYGNNMVQTPVVDKLAKKGVQFNRAYCQGPVCNPSRASITTGLRPDATRVYGNGDDFDDFAPEGIPYMANILKSKGAYLAQTGKLMHKWKHAKSVINQWDQVEYEKPFADKSGKIIDLEPIEDFYTGITKYTDIIPDLIPEIPYREWVYVPNIEVDERLKRLMFVQDSLLEAGHPDTWPLRKPFQQLMAEQVGDVGFSPEHFEDGICARLGAKMIEDFAKEDKQFLLNVGLYAPHTPLLAPQKYLDLYDTAKIEITNATRDKDINVPDIAVRKGNNYDIFNGMYPEYSPTPERQKLAIQSYYACASYIDDQVGVLLDALEKNGLSENTIVILWADHGFHLGEHCCWSKFTLFEQSTRVPLIVYVPDASGNGQQCNEIVELVDMLPTMCDLWGIEKDSRFEGFSFTPLLEDPEQDWKEAAFTLCPGPLHGRSVRTKRYKYAEYYKELKPDFDQQELVVAELYDLEKDPVEQHNVLDDPEYKEIQEKLAVMLKEGWKSALPN